MIQAEIKVLASKGIDGVIQAGLFPRLPEVGHCIWVTTHKARVLRVDWATGGAEHSGVQVYDPVLVCEWVQNSAGKKPN